MFAASVAVVLAVAAPVPKGPPDPVDAQAAKLRAKAAVWLSDAAKDGRWENKKLQALAAGTQAGVDSLATAALLEAGRSPSAEPVKAALARLADDKTEFTYTVALRTVALAKADPKKYAPQLRRNTDWLIKTAVRNNGQLAGWSYPLPPVSRADGSNTQYAVLALSVAADAGVEVDPKLWQEVRDLYVRTRRPGGWAYTEGAMGRPTQTMTAAALCGLYLADKHLGAAEAAVKNGLADWAKRYGTEDGKSVFYQWYGTARLGRLVGKPTIPGPNGRDVNWYKDGVAWLTKNQSEDGSWGRPGPNVPDTDRVVATSFALLFLGPPKN